MKNPFRKSAPRAALRASDWGVPNTTAVSIPSDLTLSNIVYDIGGSRIVDDVSFGMPSGSVTCLLGPSGSGKTTLLRIMAGIERQTSGSVLRDGREIGGDGGFVPAEKRGIGLVFQDYALFPHLTVAQNVGFGLDHLPVGARREIAERLLARVGLADRLGDYPSTLSGGEQQRVALARALAPRPGILLMDEPFSGLDARLRDEMREEALTILRETRATSVLVTHDPEEALRMGDQIALLHHGKLHQLGTGEALYNTPVTLFAAAFFGELNTFAAKGVGGRVETPFGTFAGPEGDVTVAMRTTAFEIGAGGTEARVLSSSFSGSDRLLRVGVAGLERPIRLQVPAHSMPEPATVQIGVRARADGVFVFANT